MWRGLIAAFAALLLTASPAAAHGGGFVYVPVFVYNGPPVIPDAKTGNYSNIHTVAIVTAVGQTMILGRSGWLVDHKTIDISDLKLDDFVDGALRQYLPSRFKVADVPYDRAALAAIPNGINDVSTDSLKTYLAGLPAEGVDAFIVVRPDGEAGGANTPGLSLNQGNGIRPQMEANFEIDIVDAKSHEIIGHALSRIQPRQGTNPYFADISAPVELMITPDQTPTAEQRLGLRIMYQRLLSDAIIETLRALNLGVALPMAGARVLAPVPENLRPKLKSVAIVSAIGDTVTLDHRGAFFVHDVNTATIDSWNLDSEVEADVAAALDKRIAVKQIPADRAKIEKQTFFINDDFLKTPIDGLSPSSDIDAYVVVLKTAGYMPISGAVLPGLSMRHLTPIGSAATTGFASYAIALVNPQTLLPYYIVRAVASPARPTPTVMIDIDNAEWPDDNMTLTPEQAKATHQALSAILSDSIGETLMRMKLTPLYPSDALPQASVQQGASNPGSTTAAEQHSPPSAAPQASPAP